MNRIQKLIKPSTAILASCAVAAVLLLPATSLSIDWGCGVGDCGEWVRTQAAVTKDPICFAAHQDFCREWCEENQFGQLEPTGQFCCTGPDGVCNGSDITF